MPPRKNFKKIFAENLKSIIGVILLLSSFATLVISAENHYTSKEAHKQLEMRVEQKITNDDLNNIQQRLWKYEDRYGMDENNMPPNEREEYRKLKKDKETQENKLNIIRNNISPECIK